MFTRARVAVGGVNVVKQDHIITNIFISLSPVLLQNEQSDVRYASQVLRSRTHCDCCSIFVHFKVSSVNRDKNVWTLPSFQTNREVLRFVESPSPLLRYHGLVVSARFALHRRRCYNEKPWLAGSGQGKHPQTVPSRCEQASMSTQS